MAKSPGFKNTKSTAELISELRKPKVLPETGWWNIGIDEPNEIPFEGDWGNYDDGDGYAPTSFYLSEDGEARLRGVVDGGDVGETIFVLPEEMWPEYTQVFACSVIGGGTANIKVWYDGTVELESFA